MRLRERLAIMFRGELPPAQAEDQATALRAYADFVATQLIGYQPEGGEALLRELVEPSVDGPFAGVSARARIMGAETRLAALLPDEQIARYYWLVRDRFNRVGPASALREYEADAPDRLIPHAEDPLAVAREAHAAAVAAAEQAERARETCEAALADAGAEATAEQNAALAAARVDEAKAQAAVQRAAERVTTLEAESVRKGATSEPVADATRPANERVAPPARRAGRGDVREKPGDPVGSDPPGAEPGTGGG